MKMHLLELLTTSTFKLNPLPDYWSGFRIRPLSIEFWYDGKFRLHDRVRYNRDVPEEDCNVTRLYP